MNYSQRKRRRERREQERIQKKRDKLHHCLDFNFLTAPSTLSKAALLCDKDVGWKRGSQSFMLTRMKNCIQLSNELRDGTYKKKPANHFVLHERGHTRNISAVDFRDRVVQKAYCENFLIPVLQYGIIDDNSASQKGKGTDYARDRFAFHMQQAIRNYGKDAWFISYDFKNYFASIDSEQAMDMIAHTIEPLIIDDVDRLNAQRLLNLGRAFICEEEGLGLGNQTSQVVAIAYASSIDHAIREVCQCGLSGRYMDDGYAFCRTKSDAYVLLAVVEEYAHRLGLKLHPKKSGAAPAMRHHTFLKTVFYANHDGTIRREVSRDTVCRYKRHYKSLVKLVVKGRIPMEVLDASEGSWKGVAMRATDPEKYIAKMTVFFNETKQKMLNGVPVQSGC